MAKKPAFPSKPCPKCGTFIHSRSKSHEACGWTETSSATSKPQVQTAPTIANGEAISKMEAVRRILKEFGKDTKPLEIQDHLKKQFRIKMDTSVISTYKGTILKARKKPGKPKGPKPSPAMAAPGTFTVEISLDDIRAVKALADKIGAEKVQQLAGVLAK
jgi:hypothetical protein